MAEIVDSIINRAIGIAANSNYARKHSRESHTLIELVLVEVQNIRIDLAQEIDVILGVEVRQLLEGGAMGLLDDALAELGTYVDLQVAVEFVGQNKVMCQSESLGLHGVTGAIVVVADIA